MGCDAPPRNPSAQRNADPYRPGALSTPKTLNGHKSGPFARITTIFGATKMYFGIAKAYAGATEALKKVRSATWGLKLACRRIGRTLAGTNAES